MWLNRKWSSGNDVILLAFAIPIYWCKKYTCFCYVLFCRSWITLTWQLLWYIYYLTSTHWITLDLFNDDTCPSGHISRPAHVNVYQNCLHSLNKLLKHYYIVQAWGLDEVNKFHQIGGDSSDELYRMSDHSYHIEESRFSQEFHYARLGNCLKEGIQWVSSVVPMQSYDMILVKWTVKLRQPQQCLHHGLLRICTNSMGQISGTLLTKTLEIIALKYHNSSDFELVVKYIFCGICVQHFVWNSKGHLYVKFWSHTHLTSRFTVLYFCMWFTISLNCGVIRITNHWDQHKLVTWLVVIEHIWYTSTYINLNSRLH